MPIGVGSRHRRPERVDRIALSRIREIVDRCARLRIGEWRSVSRREVAEVCQVAVVAMLVVV